MTEPIDLATPAAEDGGPAATDSPAPAPRGSWAALMPALLLVALVAATAVGAVALQRRESGPYDAAPQIGWMRQGCARWAASSGMGLAKWIDSNDSLRRRPSGIVWRSVWAKHTRSSISPNRSSRHTPRRRLATSECRL